MRGDTELGNLVHLMRADLHLKGHTEAPDDGGVERAVEVWLRGGNVVLEAPGDRFIHLVDDAEHGVAFQLRVYNDAKRVKEYGLEYYQIGVRPLV